MLRPNCFFGIHAGMPLGQERVYMAHILLKTIPEFWGQTANAVYFKSLMAGHRATMMCNSLLWDGSLKPRFFVRSTPVMIVRLCAFSCPYYPFASRLAATLSRRPPRSLTPSRRRLLLFWRRSLWRTSAATQPRYIIRTTHGCRTSE